MRCGPCSKLQDEVRIVSLSCNAVLGACISGAGVLPAILVVLKCWRGVDRDIVEEASNSEFAARWQLSFWCLAELLAPASHLRGEVAANLTVQLSSAIPALRGRPVLRSLEAPFRLV